MPHNVATGHQEHSLIQQLRYTLAEYNSLYTEGQPLNRHCTSYHLIPTTILWKNNTRQEEIDTDWPCNLPTELVSKGVRLCRMI